jgi:transposase
VWEPLIEAVRPRGKTPPKELRRTMAAIFWRHRNGATWRAIPTELGPWWLAAQLFIRWAALGAWERLLELAQEHAGGLELGLAFLDGTNIRAHAKAAGAPKKGELQKAETSVKRLVALAAASAPRPLPSRTHAVAP